MNFPNPFKKKEDDFTLNEAELPSLSDSMSNESSPSSDFPSLPDIGSTPSSDLGSGYPPSSPTPSPEENVQGLPGLSSQTNDFSSSPSLPSSNPFDTSGSTSTPESSSGGANQDLHNEISRVKLETMDSKLVLMDARMAAMEQKLELIFQMISSEVSEETKRKLKVDSMMNKIR